MKFFLIVIFFGILAFSDSMASGNNKKPHSESKISSVNQLKPGVINQDLAKIVYSGGETLKYDVFYSGGIKIGKIIIEVNRSEQCEDCYEIGSTITSKGGAVHYLYPIEDVHTTIVKGKDRLPFFSEIWQQQGMNYKAHKTVQFDQEKYVLIKQKEGDAARTYELDGVVHNEFSSFFSSRIMDLEVGSPILVPTFGDDKRIEVVVITLEKGILDTGLFGEIKTLKVAPVLTFSGLYDKKGDTTIWYTDDECRLPVLIKSKIVIGSLTASLVQYHNPLCLRYNKSMEKE